METTIELSTIKKYAEKTEEVLNNFIYALGTPIPYLLVITKTDEDISVLEGDSEAWKGLEDDSDESIDDARGHSVRAIQCDPLFTEAKCKQFKKRAMQAANQENVLSVVAFIPGHFNQTDEEDFDDTEDLSKKDTSVKGYQTLIFTPFDNPAIRMTTYDVFGEIDDPQPLEMGDLLHKYNTEIESSDWMDMVNKIDGEEIRVQAMMENPFHMIEGDL
jgi:hypothetical protein